MILYPLATEKAVRLIETENKITFVVEKKASKKEIKNELEERFKVKVEKVNVEIKKNRKIAYIKLKPDTPAIDIATKLGLM